MKRFTVLTALAFLLAAAVPLSSHAQFKVGPRATIDVGDIEEFAIGGDVRYNLSQVNAPIQLSGAFDFYFADDVQIGTEEASRTIFTVDLNGHYVFPTEGTISPYAGAGLGITNVSVDIDTPAGNSGGDDTDIGLNLVGGVEFQTGSVRPFAQGQVSFGGDFTRFGITGGVLFTL
jgi:opacity protein-like surface antigen